MTSQAIPQQLRTEVAEALSMTESDVVMTPFGKLKGVADETFKYTVGSGNSNPTAMLLYAAEVAPEMVRRGNDRARMAQAALGPPLDRVPLVPLAEGYVDDRSYAVLPFLDSWSDNRIVRRLQLMMYSRPILDWLRESAIATAKKPTAEDQDGFLGSLEYLRDEDEMTRSIRDAAREALERMASGAWKPIHVLMHGDLWYRNVLFNPGRGWIPERESISIIDWAGAIDSGYGMYDLVRMAISFSLPDDRLRREIGLHCQIMECDSTGGHYQLLAALGYLGLHREEFPLDRYLKLANVCVDRYLTATGSDE